MTWLDRLRRYLESRGAQTEVSDDPPGLLITSYEGDPASPRVLLAMGDADLEAQITMLAPSANDVFPGAPMEAAYSLFLVHLEEEIESRDADELVLRPDGKGGLEVEVRGERQKWPPPSGRPGDYEWRAHP